MKIICTQGKPLRVIWGDHSNSPGQVELVHADDGTDCLGADCKHASEPLPKCPLGHEVRLGLQPTGSPDLQSRQTRSCDHADVWTHLFVSEDSTTAADARWRELCTPKGSQLKLGEK